MKLPELKNRFKSKYAIRIVAGVLVVALVGTNLASSNVYAAKSSGKAAVESTEKTEETESTEKEDDGEKLVDKLTKNISVEETEIGKDETVYVIADNTGKEQNIIVSDHLINKDDKDTLEDASTLKDIENIKGNETFTQNGNKVTWKADGNDIFYQGTSTEALPVTQKITYFLDGKEVTPEELAGALENLSSHMEHSDGEDMGDKIKSWIENS